MILLVYGYCRISTKSQSIERQIRNIQVYDKSATILKETYTGTKVDKPVLQRLLSKVKASDTIIFDSVSRMSRKADEGFRLYKELYEKGVALVFLKERHIDTQAYKDALKGIVNIDDVRTGSKETDNLVNTIMSAVNQFMLAKVEQDIFKAFEQSEKEVQDLRQRTKEGLITAKLNGKRVGTPKGSTYKTKKAYKSQQEIIRLSRDFEGSNLDKEVIKLIGISRNSYYKYKAELLGMSAEEFEKVKNYNAK